MTDTQADDIAAAADLIDALHSEAEQGVGDALNAEETETLVKGMRSALSQLTAAQEEIDAARVAICEALYGTVVETDAPFADMVKELTVLTTEHMNAHKLAREEIAGLQGLNIVNENIITKQQALIVELVEHGLNAGTFNDDTPLWRKVAKLTGRDPDTGNIITRAKEGSGDG